MTNLADMTGKCFSDTSGVVAPLFKGMIMSRTSLIKLIHVARRDLQLDDDTYRAFLTAPADVQECAMFLACNCYLMRAVVRSTAPARKVAHSPDCLLYTSPSPRD